MASARAVRYDVPELDLGGAVGRTTVAFDDAEAHLLDQFME